MSGLKQFPREDLVALLTISFVKFLAIFGVAALETFGVSYIINELGVPENSAAMNVAIYFVGYLLAAIPVVGLDLAPTADGGWEGRWLVFEKMGIRIMPKR